MQNCQRCGNALLLDESLVELVSPKHQLLAASNVTDSGISGGGGGGVKESFVFLQNSPSASTTASKDLTTNINSSEITENNKGAGGGRGLLSHRLKILQKINDLAQLGGANEANLQASILPQIPQLMCQECVGLLLDALSRRNAELCRDRERYAEFLGRVQAGLPTSEEQTRLEKELQQLEVAEKQHLGLIEELEAQLVEQEREFDQLLLQERELDQQEQMFWQSWNETQNAAQSVRDEKTFREMETWRAEKELERLRESNVWNDVFRIGYRGKVATINGLRMGRLPGEPVDWTEINAAWGQTALLLQTIANRLNFGFQGYKLYPLGSFSRIEKLQPAGLSVSARLLQSFTSINPAESSSDVATSYDLYGSGELYGFMRNRQFEHGMVAFLACIAQLGEFAERLDPTFRLPYRIRKDKIGDASIRLQYNSDDTWTKALRCVLTNCKWLLAFAAGQNPRRNLQGPPSSPLSIGSHSYLQPIPPIVITELGVMGEMSHSK